MSGRFTLAGLLMGVTLVALVLAIVVPSVRYARRVETHADSVVSVAASADGSTFAALMGDGRWRTRSATTWRGRRTDKAWRACSRLTTGGNHRTSSSRSTI